MKNSFFIFCVALLVLFLFGCNKADLDIEVPNDSIPRLNSSDSLAMVQIYNENGPWGNEWDLKDIQTWGGVEISLDLSTNQYRITGFNYNGSFWGTISSGFRKLTELKILGLGGGELNGNIPDWIGELTNLESLYIGYNKVIGEIPKEIGKLKKLRYLTIGVNRVGGTLPEELGDLESLEQLTIMNTYVEGEIPKSLKKLKKVTWITLDNNRLCGDFPIEILREDLLITCRNNNLTSLDFKVWRDDFKGALPDITKNQLSGEIPLWVIESQKWKKKGFLVGSQQKGFGYINYNWSFYKM